MALDLYKLQGTIELDISGAERGLSRFSARAKQAESALDETSTSASHFTQKLAVLESTITTLRSRLHAAMEQARQFGHSEHQAAADTALLRAELDKLEKEAREIASTFQKDGQASQELASRLTAARRSSQDLSAAIGDTGRSSTRTASALGVLGQGLQQIGQTISSIGTSLTIGVTAPILALGAAAYQSAKGIDAQVSQLKALTGSADAAERRFANLTKLAQKTPGLTANLAATLDAQMRVADVTEKTIDRILPAIGKLNAISPLGDPQQFASNLNQLISQGFERADLKELVGRSPLSGEIIKQMFGTSSATDGEEIAKRAEKLGLTTADKFFEAFAKAVETNSKTANVTESIGARVDKMIDRVMVALRPLGLAIINALEPVVNAAIPIIERLAEWFKSLSPAMQTAAVIAGGLAAALGPALVVLGGLISVIGSVVAALASLAGALAVAGSFTALVAVITPVLVVLGKLILVVTAVVAALVAAVVAIVVAWKTNFGGIRDLTAQVTAFIQERWAALVGWWNENLPMMKEIALAVWKTIANTVQYYSGLVKAIIIPAWNYISTFLRETLSILGSVIKFFLQLITGRWGEAANTLKEIWNKIWEAIKTLMAQSLVSLKDMLVNWLAALIGLDGQAMQSGMSIGSAIGAGMLAGIRANFPLIADAIEGMMNWAGTRGRAVPPQMRTGGGGIDSGWGADGWGEPSDDFAKNPPPPSSGKSKKSKGASGPSPAERAARMEVDLAQVAADEMRRIWEQKVNDEAWALDQNKSTLAVYLATKKSAEEANNLMALDALKAERRLALVEKATREERVARLAQIDEQIAAQKQQNVDNLTKIEREGLDKQLSAQRQAWSDKLNLQQETNSGFEAAYRSLADAGVLTFQQAQDRIAAQQREFLAAQKAGLERDLAATVPGSFGYEQISAQLDQKRQQIANFEAENERSMTEARRRDFDREASHADRLRGVTSQIEDLRRSSQARQLQLLEAFGVRKEVIWQRQMQLDLQAEQVATARRIAEIERERQYVELFEQNAERKAAIIQSLNALIVAEEQRSADEREAIQGDFYAKHLDRLRGIAAQITDAFGQALDQFKEKGWEGFFQSIGDSFKNLLKQMALDLLKSKVLQLLQKLTNMPSVGSGGQAAGGSGGGFNLGSLLGGGGNGGSGGFLQQLLGGPGGTSGFAGPVSGQGGGSLGGLFKGGSFLGKIGGFLGLGGGAAAGGAAASGTVTAGGLILPNIAAIGASSAAAAGTGATAAATAAGITGGTAGGAGLFAGLAPLLTNPITAIVAGAIAGGFLLHKLFSGRDLKKLRSTIKSEWNVDVGEKKVLQQIKEIGKAQYGKLWEKQMVPLVHLDPVKNIIASYAESRGQGENKLALEKRKLDPNDPINRYEIPIERREYGGPVIAGHDYIVGERRAEYFRPSVSGHIEPSVPTGNGVSNGNAGITHGQWQAVIAELQALRAQLQPVNGDEFFMAKLKRNAEDVARTANAGQRGSGYALNTFGDAGY